MNTTDKAYNAGSSLLSSLRLIERDVLEGLAHPMSHTMWVLHSRECGVCVAVSTDRGIHCTNTTGAAKFRDVASAANWLVQFPCRDGQGNAFKPRPLREVLLEELAHVRQSINYVENFMPAS